MESILKTVRAKHMGSTNSENKTFKVRRLERRITEVDRVTRTKLCILESKNRMTFRTK